MTVQLYGRTRSTVRCAPLVISDWEAYYPFMPTTTDVSSETFTDDDDDDGGGEEIYVSENERGEYNEGNNNIGIDLFEVED
jgi:hypothetical protein